MKKSCITPLLCACCGCLAYAANSPSIAVFVDFENAPSEATVLQMKAEVATILKASGLALDWRLLNSRADHETFNDLAVVRFSGSCQVRNPAMDSELGPAIDHVPLATTAVSDGHTLPFSDVRCDQVRRFLAPNLALANPRKRDGIYGRALGRVVAHELYHVFAATEKHAKVGVARESHSRRELTGRQFRFTASETAVLHEFKIRAMLAGEGGNISPQ